MINILSLKQQVAELSSLYSRSGYALPIGENGLPVGVASTALLSPGVAALALDSALLAPIRAVLPPLPTDWTQPAPAANLTDITSGIALLNQLQRAGSLTSKPLLQHAYASTLSLILLNATQLRYESVEQAQALRKTLHAHLLTLAPLLENTDGNLIGALRDLLVVVDAAADQQLATLPHVTLLTPKVETPALVLVWANQHDSSQAENLLARNPHILHPLFVSPARPVELLQ